MEQEQNGASQDMKRWTAKRETALVQELIRVRATVVQTARTYDLTPFRLRVWLEGAPMRHGKQPEKLTKGCFRAI